MTPNEQLFDKLKEWHPKELEMFAAKLLVLARPSLHGNIQLHYAHGIIKKMVVSETKDM